MFLGSFFMFLVLGFVDPSQNPSKYVFLVVCFGVCLFLVGWRRKVVLINFKIYMIVQGF